MEQNHRDEEKRWERENDALDKEKHLKELVGMKQKEADAIIRAEEENSREAEEDKLIEQHKSEEEKGLRERGQRLRKEQEKQRQQEETQRKEKEEDGRHRSQIGDDLRKCKEKAIIKEQQQKIEEENKGQQEICETTRENIGEETPITYIYPAVGGVAGGVQGFATGWTIGTVAGPIGQGIGAAVGCAIMGFIGSMIGHFHDLEGRNLDRTLENIRVFLQFYHRLAGYFRDVKSKVI